MDQTRYDRIIKACGLLPDFKILPAQDRTEIGERGINLSGGQKQRVSLARAAYQEADIYLLDDPLSAVDAHVDQHLWGELIGPLGLLKDKTRLMITHGIHHLHEIEQIVVIKDGIIQETGNYTDLMAAGSSFSQLITEFSVADQNQEESPKNSSVVQDQVEEVKQLTEIVPTMEYEATAKKDVQAELVAEEEAAEGSVGLRVINHYAQAR